MAPANTKIELVAKRLRESGRRFSLVAAPRYGSPTGQLVKRAPHGEFGDFVGLNPYLSAMPYLLDFAASQPALEKLLKRDRSSRIAISSRRLPSTAPNCPRVHVQHSSISSRRLCTKEFKLPKPDLVIYFDISVEQAQKNIRSKKKDQREKDVGYQKRVAEVYRQLARRKEWRAIPCITGGEMRSPEEIHELVWKAVQ